jgi:hypothetical protein
VCSVLKATADQEDLRKHGSIQESSASSGGLLMLLFLVLRVATRANFRLSTSMDPSHTYSLLLFRSDLDLLT